MKLATVGRGRVCVAEGPNWDIAVKRSYLRQGKGQFLVEFILGVEICLFKRKFIALTGGYLRWVFLGWKL